MLSRCQEFGSYSIKIDLESEKKKDRKRESKRMMDRKRERERARWTGWRLKAKTIVPASHTLTVML